MKPLRNKIVVVARAPCACGKETLEGFPVTRPGVWQESALVGGVKHTRRACIKQT